MIAMKNDARCANKLRIPAQVTDDVHQCDHSMIIFMISPVKTDVNRDCRHYNVIRRVDNTTDRETSVACFALRKYYNIT